MFSVDGLDFRKYLHGKQKFNIIFTKTTKKKNHKNEHSKLRKIRIMRYYLPGRRRSLISMLKKGRNKLPQKGHVVLRFESSAVQPAIISSS